MHNVVLVDDDDLYREVLSADLADRGYSVMTFADGPSLLKALGKGIAAEVALLDWDLPVMSGFELLGILRSLEIQLPILFLTGYASVERELQALDRGAVDFVEKDRGTDVLAHRLRLIIEGHRQRASSDATQVQIEAQSDIHGGIILQRETASAQWRGQDVQLTIAEYRVVALLVSDSTLKTHRAIYDAVHFPGFVGGYGTHGYISNVRSMMKRIRKKFLAVDPSFLAIKTVPALGYQWLDPKPSH